MTAPLPVIESTDDYKAAANRIAAIDEVVEAIQHAKGVAVSYKSLDRLTNDDMNAIAPLTDALADLAYERAQIDQACREWETVECYGSAA